MLDQLTTLFRTIFLDRYSPDIELSGVTTSDPVQSSIPRYPPNDKGLDLVSLREILESQGALIERINRTAGLPADEFNRLYMPVINSLVAYVHLLPATKTGHHRGAGGLFRLCLEIGLHSLQIANSTIFSDRGAATAEMRFKMHPRWVYASFIAGVCSELYRPVTDMIVVDKDGEKWPSLIHSLHEWASKRGNTYHIIWNTQDEVDVIASSQATSAFIMTKIVPASGLQYLNEGSEIMASLTMCVANSTPHGVTNQIQKIVSEVKKKVIERDLARNSELYGDFSVGSHLEPHLIDCMRKLVKSGKWAVNSKGGRIWNSSEGMFIVWSLAAREISDMLRDASLAGIPTDIDTMCDILLNCGVAEPNRQDGRYWEICVPITMQLLTAIKLSRVEILFDEPDEVSVLKATLFPGKNEGVVQKSTNQKSLEFSLSSVESPMEISPTASKEVAPSSDSETSKPTPSRPPSSTPSEQAKKKPPQITAPGPVADDVTKALFSSLPKEVSDLLRAIVEDHIDGSSTGPVFSVEGGVAISVQEIESHGQSNFTGLVQALDNKKWLWVNDERPMLKLHDTEYDGKKLKSIIIKTDIARSLGLKWKQPRKSGK